jgi:hypothetical protein
MKSLAQRALENRRAEQLAKVLPRSQPRMDAAARRVLADRLAAAGIAVSLQTVVSWSKSEQAEAYLWTLGEGRLPACIDPEPRAIAARLREVRMYVCEADVVRWSRAQRLAACSWAALFAGGREDLPPPPHVYDVARL